MRLQTSRALVSAALAFVLAPQVLLAQYAINTVAGGGPNNLTALNASIGYPDSIALDAAGNIYIADSYSNHIFKVDATGNLTVVAGNGTPGYSGDGGPATSAALNNPEGVFVDGSGNIFIADTDNFAIREVAASTTDIITTVAGTLGVQGYSPNGTVATSADLNYPSNMVVDSSGDIYIADTDNFVIREVTGGAIETVVGNNTLSYSGDGGLAVDAELSAPAGVALDASGNLYIGDSDNSAVREVVTASGDIQTVAGSLTSCAVSYTHLTLPTN